MKSLHEIGRGCGMSRISQGFCCCLPDFDLWIVQQDICDFIKRGWVLEESQSKACSNSDFIFRILQKLQHRLDRPRIADFPQSQGCACSDRKVFTLQRL